MLTIIQRRFIFSSVIVIPLACGMSNVKADTLRPPKPRLDRILPLSALIQTNTTYTGSSLINWSRTCQTHTNLSTSHVQESAVHDQQ